MKYIQSIFSLLSILVLPINQFFSFSYPEMSYNISYQTAKFNSQSMVFENGFVCNFVVDVSVSECQALVDLYESTIGADWSTNDNWLSSLNVDDWFGVKVEENKVVEVILSSNNLSGTLPDSLENLIYLQVLQLSFNQISGSIPESLGNLIHLEYLELGHNQITGSIPESIGSLVNLVCLFLSINQLSGSIPGSLGNLVNIKILQLDENQLSGSIPNSLGYLINLESLFLSSNQLYGSIPNEIGNMNNLIYLEVGLNQLSGSIPVEIGQLENLVYLSMHSNDLSGIIPTEISKLGELSTLRIEKNDQLSGSIPLSFIKLNSLYSFYFSSTNLCEPSNPEFIEWKETVNNWSGTDIICKFVFLPMINR